MNNVFEQVLVLLVMMAAGYAAVKTGLLGREAGGVLTKLVLNITSPLLVIHSFQLEYDGKLLIDMGFMALYAALSLAVFTLLGARIWPKGDDGRRRVLWQATVFSNCGFMGYPVLFSLFGATGIVYGSVYIMVYTVYTWTVGVYIFAGKSGGIRDVLLQPGLIAVAVGVALFLSGLRLPAWAGAAVEGLGSMTTPLAMLIVGTLVAEIDFKSILREWLLFAASAVRLVALPALALGAFWLPARLGAAWAPGLAEPVVACCVLITAMPVAANVAIFAKMYDVKPAFAAQTVLVSTLLSVATVPLWMMAIRALGGQ